MHACIRSTVWAIRSSAGRSQLSSQRSVNFPAFSGSLPFREGGVWLALCDRFTIVFPFPRLTAGRPSFAQPTAHVSYESYESVLGFHIRPHPRSLHDQPSANVRLHAYWHHSLRPYPNPYPRMSSPQRKYTYCWSHPIRKGFGVLAPAKAYNSIAPGRWPLHGEQQPRYPFCLDPVCKALIPLVTASIAATRATTVATAAVALGITTAPGSTWSWPQETTSS